MRSSKVVLGCVLLVLLGYVATVEAAEHKKETEYCRNARKECEEKCKDMEMMGWKCLFLGTEAL